jgi:hypothetical protein
MGSALGFLPSCPSCLGRRMASTAANRVEHVLPTSAPLRQWVLTVPHPWRKRLAYDGELLGALTRIFVSTVLGFYKARLKREGAANGQSGAVVVVQRTSSDLKTNPHLHVIFLDGVYRELGDEAVFRELPRLSSIRPLKGAPRISTEAWPACVSRRVARWCSTRVARQFEVSGGRSGRAGRCDDSLDDEARAVCLFPAVWKKGGEIVLRLILNPEQDIGEVDLGVDVVSLAHGEERVEDHEASTGLLVAEEE